MVANIVFKYFFIQEAMTIGCDGSSAIILAKNLAYHSNTKHIDVQYHFVRDMAKQNKVLLEKVDTKKNVADSLPKFVNTEKLSWCRESMSMVLLEYIKTTHNLG